MEMSFVRSRVVTLAIAFAFVLSGVAAAAQNPDAAPPRRPAQSTARPVEAPPPDQSTDTEEIVHSPVVRVGQNYTVPAGESVSDIHAFLSDVTIDGHVRGDAVVTLGSLRLGSNAVVDGTLVVAGGNATIAEGAAVHRDFVVVGGALEAPAAFAPGGMQTIIGTPIIGQRLRSLVPWVTRGLLWGRLIVPDLKWIWLIVGVVFLVGLVLNLLFDGPIRACAGVIVERPLTSFLLGLFVLLLTPLALVIIGASVIGLAIVPIALCAVIAAAIVGKIGVVRAIGGTALGGPESGGRLAALGAYVIGFAVLCLAYMVPIVGLVTWAITGALGLGAAAVTFRLSLRREHPARPRVPEPAVVEPAILGASPSSPPAAAPVYEPPAAPVDFAAAPAAAPAAGVAMHAHAAFLDRVAAFALDCILVAIAVQVLDVARYDGAYFLWLFIYHVAFWAWRGTTMGGIVCGLRIVRTQGTDMRVVDAVVRGLASIFSIGALGIGCLWMLQDPERQMWHDKIAGTYVVKVPRELLLA